MAEGSTESLVAPCRIDSSLTDCPLQGVHNMCVTMKPPPFPPWMNDSEVATLKMDCSSYQVYEQLCIQGRGAFVGIASTSALPPDSTNITSNNTVDNTTVGINVTESSTWSNRTDNVTFFTDSLKESPSIAHHWIGPGFVLSLAAVMLVFTIVFYIWHKTHRKKYEVEPRQYIDYNYLHNKAIQKINWNDPDFDNKQKIVPVELCVRALVKQGTIHDDDLHITSVFCESKDNYKDSTIYQKAEPIPPDDVIEVTMSSPDTSGRPEDQSQPNVRLPYNNSEYDNAEAEITMKWGRTCNDTEPQRDLESVSDMSSRVRDVGYVNAAYDGNDSVKEGRSPKRRSFFSWLF